MVRWVNVAAQLAKVLGYENALDNAELLYVGVLLLYIYSRDDARQPADPLFAAYSHTKPHPADLLSLASSRDNKWDDSLSTVASLPVRAVDLVSRDRARLGARSRSVGHGDP